MASLERVGDRIRIRYRNKGDRNQRSLTLPAGTGVREAERVKGDIEMQVRLTGRYEAAVAPPADLGGAIDQYIAERGRRTRRGRAAKPRTLRLYDVVLRKLFLPYAAGRGDSASLFTLEKGTVGRFLDDLAAQGKSESTVYTYGATVRAFWKWAHKRWPDHVSRPEVDVAPPTPGTVHAPTIAEVDRMVVALTAKVRGRNRFPLGVYRATVLMRFTGLRTFQAKGLRWGDLVEDFDGEGPALHIRPENSKTRAEAALDRRIPLTPELYRTLLAWRLADGRPGDDAPIVGPRFPRDPHETVRRAWERAKVPAHKWAGRPDHALRRALVTFLAEQGVPDAAIDWYVGHGGRSINARYYTAQSRAWWGFLLPALEKLPEMPTAAAPARRAASGV